MKSRSCFEFTGEEEFFQGHFPGAPILPGVIQLELAVKAAQELIGGEKTLKAVKKMKFTGVIQPRQKIELEVEGENLEYSYRFLKGEKTCSSGILEFC